MDTHEQQEDPYERAATVAKALAAAGDLSRITSVLGGALDFRTTITTERRTMDTHSHQHANLAATITTASAYVEEKLLSVSQNAISEK